MKQNLLKVVAGIGVSALALSGCASAPTTSTSAGSSTSASAQTSESTSASTNTSETAAATDFKACMVSDSGGFDDKSFNETAYAGLTRAESELGVEKNQIESNAEVDYTKNVQAMIDAKCDIIVTVGFALASATEAAAKANPDVDFAIVDNGSFEGVTNAKGLTFNTAESSFLAGYLAAAMSQTGMVGTFGGAKYPTVTIFMDGFAQGVQQYNQAKGKDVKVLGWDAAKQDGQFIPNNNFEDVDGGKNIADGLIAQGADVILPVAGPAGAGALQAAKASGGKVNAIWVDTDGCVSSAEYCSSIISSVEKGMDVAVFQAIKDSMEGNFSSEAYVGTLENEGTSLAEFHEFDSKVTDETKAELEQLKADIISGKITITSQSQPS